MKLVVSGVHIGTGDSFRAQVQQSLEAFNLKNAIEPVEVHVAITKEVVYKFRIDISYQMYRGIVVRSHGEGQDPHFCFDNALHKLEQLIHRQKRRLVAHHKHGSGRQSLKASYYVLEAEEPDLEDDTDLEDELDLEAAYEIESLAPPIIAELTAYVPTLTVGEAVMRLDLAQQTAMMFYNEGHGRLNMVYRRPDGNIGWVDPGEAAQ
jgi:ribosomal subunit interface protein